MERCRIVIPFYGDKRPLEACLKTVPHDRYMTTVVDSNPPAKRKYFTEAVNTGIIDSLDGWDGRSQLAIWVLNADTTVTQETIDAALRCFDEEGWDKCGIVGSKSLLSSNPDRIFFGGAERCYPGGKHKSGLVSNGDCNLRTEEEWLTFASVFINARMIREIGLLDKNLEHIYSDSDYCYRARYAGWKCFYEPKSIVLHEVGSSHHSTDMVLNQVKARDAERFKRKWISGLYPHLSSYDVKGNKV